MVAEKLVKVSWWAALVLGGRRRRLRGFDFFWKDILLPHSRHMVTWFENKILINRNLDESESNLANGVDKYAV